MNHDKLLNNEKGSSFFGAKIKIENSAGRFTLRTLSTMAELSQAFQLRFQVFQVEMGGGNVFEGRDHDEFDWVSDHIGIFDSKSDQMIATCRLNCSLFSNKFYSEQEFNCSQLIQQPQTKLEIGRVCVRREFRKGIVIMLLWRAIAQYMNKSQARFLFGCGSVQLFRYMSYFR